MVNAQKWLDRFFPPVNPRWRGEKSLLEELDIDYKGLEGGLDLSGFVNLEILSCSVNKLTSLKLDGCLKLRTLSVDNNKLTSLDLKNNPKLRKLSCRYCKLTSLDLSKNKELESVHVEGNNISANLNIFSHLVNLKYLYLGWNTGTFISNTGRNREHNKFFGSLLALKNCQKLSSLSIVGQENIFGRLDDLPPAVEFFYCQGTNLQAELELAGFNYDLAAWKDGIFGLNREIRWLEEELEIERDHAKNMDNWYQRQLGKKAKRENLTDRIIEGEKKIKAAGRPIITGFASWQAFLITIAVAVVTYFFAKWKNRAKKKQAI